MFLFSTFFFYCSNNHQLQTKPLIQHDRCGNILARHASSLPLLASLCPWVSTLNDSLSLCSGSQSRLLKQ